VEQSVLKELQPLQEGCGRLAKIKDFEFFESEKSCKSFSLSVQYKSIKDAHLIL